MGGGLDTERRATRTDDDEAPQPERQDGTSSTRFLGGGMIPPVLGFPGGTAAPSASDRAFGSVPLASEGDLKAQADRMDAERLLTSKDVTSGQDAVAALEILLSVADGQKGKVIDHLSERAFDNLLDRLSDDHRVRLASLVDASQDPKRKLKLWAAQHKSRAHQDLQRYAGDFGDPDGDQTKAQERAQAKYDRRKKGVDATDNEVSQECAALLAKGNKLTVADVDAMRARKDRELDVEMEHNINLNAESEVRADGSRVVWEKDEVDQLDAALDNVPDKHVHDANSVHTYTRRANRHILQTRGGEYQNDKISVYDNANKELPGRAQVKPVEYTVAHETGHEVETENAAAFKKFKKAAGWQEFTRKDLEAKGIGDEDIDEMHNARRVGDKVYKHDDDGKYYAHDETAIPSFDETNNDRWKYSNQNAQEHWAEAYAMAVEAPELLYSDYVEKPVQHMRVLRDRLAEQQRSSQRAPANIGLQTKMRETERELVRAEKVVKQRRELYDIMRNDVFGADKGTQAAVERLRKRGLDDKAIHAFEERAARVSTPKQIAELEREAM